MMVAERLCWQDTDCSTGYAMKVNDVLAERLAYPRQQAVH